MKSVFTSFLGFTFTLALYPTFPQIHKNDVAVLCVCGKARYNAMFTLQVDEQVKPRNRVASGCMVLGLNCL